MSSSTMGIPSAPSLGETTTTATTAVIPKKKAQLKGIPIFEYQDRGFKWVIENHTSESVKKEISNEGVISFEVSDAKQQVYIYNCENITVKITGKIKSLLLDKCTHCSVIFDSIVSVAETVNCKKIQFQVTGICPAFTLDKTVGVLIWLSKEAKDIATVTTSLSSEMNISYPEGDDQKEIPIPEQFVHKFTNGSLRSEISDLYH
jgi:adenylyl cyclase-associated protein